MGVKEYKFLTRTMKTITARSNKLEKANKRLLNIEDDLKDLRDSARGKRATIKTSPASQWWKKGRQSHNKGKLPRKEFQETEASLKTEINSVKRELKAKKEKIPFFVPNVHGSDWKFGSEKIGAILVLFVSSFFLITIIFIFKVEEFRDDMWICDNGDSINSRYVLDGDNDCSDGSDEGELDPEDLAATAAARKFENNLFGNWCGGIILLTLISMLLIQNVGEKKYSPIVDLESKMRTLEIRYRTMEKQEGKRIRLDSELKELNMELSLMESDIEDSVKRRDWTKKKIKLLEKEIPQLWDSIAHLIPFSTALEKA